MRCSKIEFDMHQTMCNDFVIDLAYRCNAERLPHAAHDISWRSLIKRWTYSAARGWGHTALGNARLS